MYILSHYYLLANLSNHTDRVDVPIHLGLGDRHDSSQGLERLVVHVGVHLLQSRLQRVLKSLRKTYVSYQRSRCSHGFDHKRYVVTWIRENVSSANFSGLEKEKVVAGDDLLLCICKLPSSK